MLREWYRMHTGARLVNYVLTGQRHDIIYINLTLNGTSKIIHSFITLIIKQNNTYFLHKFSPH